MKKNFKAFIVLQLFYLMLPTWLLAQQIREIHVGEKLPDIILYHVLNKPENRMRLSGLYKGKSLLISFWASWCIPCIREMKLLDAIAPPLAGQLNLLAVTYQDEQTIRSLLSRQNIGSNSYRTLVSSDIDLRKYFPYKYLPQNIWVNSEGIVTGITGGEEISKENLKKFIKGKLNFKSEKHDDMAFDPFKTYHVEDSSFSYRSILTKRNPDINSGIVWDRSMYEPKYFMKRVFVHNCSLLDMICFAFAPYIGNWTDINYRRLKVITSDSTRFFFPKKIQGFKNSSYKSENDWFEQNLFCYELSLPNPVSDTIAGEHILEDLHRNFKFHAAVEQTEMPGWAILKLPNKLDQPLNDTTSINEFVQAFVAKNVTLKDVIAYIQNNHRDAEPIVDETADTRHFDFTLPNDGHVLTVEYMMAQLERAGFVIERKLVKCTRIVVKD